MAPLSTFLKHYEEFKNKIFTYCLYRVSFDRETAEDLTSEIFLKAYEHFDSFDETRSFRAWIYTIAHNHLMNHFASSKKTLPLEEARTASIDPTFVRKVENTLLMDKVLTYMKELSDFERTLIFLRFKEGLSHREIADIVDKNEGAVRVALSRALAALRQRMDLPSESSST